MVTRHGQLWVAPGPLWTTLLRDAKLEAFARPAVVTLAGDDFMERLVDLFAGDDGGRGDAVAALRIGAGSPRLFQPIHGRYAVVLASLACTLPGLPDHVVGPRERVGFVVRRVAGAGELAWVCDGKPDQGRWTAVQAPGKAILAGEEVHALFPVMWRDHGRVRRAWAGVVPISARERYEAAAAQASGPEADPETWELALDARFFDPMDRLRAANESSSPPPDDSVAVLTLILDLVGLMRARTGCSDAELRALWSVGATDLSAEILAAAVADPADARAVDGVPGLALTLFFDMYTKDRQDLRARLVALPGPAVPSPSPPAGDGEYRVRCVYERPPCGVRATQVVSSSSDAFRIASFLDLDAPQRPVHIGLPDLSPQNLGKLARTVAFSMNGDLHAKAERVRKAKVRVDGDKLAVDMEDPADGAGIRWISIWSIPIITVCATILLMIVATILDYVFRWLPFLRILIPVREAKED